MRDFIISILVAAITNIYIISPYWDRLKGVWIIQGHTMDQINPHYYLLCAVSYLAVGLVVYGTIKFVKWVNSSL